MSYTPKHGDIFAVKDREHLAVSMNGNIKTFSPNQWYLVLSGSIAKGVCVSIHNDGTSTGKLIVTDADSMSRAVGLTLNATVNGKNEVQSTGLYNFDFDMFSTLDIGKPVYLGDGGALTTSKVDATSQSENIIELGIVVSQRSMFLDIEGDTRDGIVTTVKPLLAGEAIVTDGSPRLVSIGSDGKVYLADKRKDRNTTPEQRNHTFGFIIGATSGYPITIPEDATVIVQTAGILKGDFGLSGSLGRTLFLHDNGTWTANSNAFNYHSDVYQPVGIAIETGEIYVSISEPSQYNVYFPIGSVIAQGGVTPDYGWLSCDGSEVSKLTYADLYAVIGDVYGTPVNSNNFMLPPSTSVDQQIKFSNWYAEVPATAPVFRYDSGILPYNGSVPGSELIIPTNTFGFDPPLSDMFAEVYITNGTITRRIDATIISNTYENIILIKKEYQCQLYKDSANQIKIKIADNGFAYYDSAVLGGFSELPTDGSWTYRVYVYKTEKFNKFFDYTGDTKLQQMWDLGLHDLIKAPTEQGVGKLDVGTTDPSSLASRLNYNGEFHATQFHADVAQGTPPLVVTSTTQVDNLNAGLLNNQTAGDIIVASTAVAVAGGRTNFIKNSLDSTDSGFWTRLGGGTALTYVPAGTVDISANGGHRLSTFTSGQYIDGDFKDVDGVHGGKAWEISFGFYIPVGGTYTTNDLQVYVVTGTGLEILVDSIQPLQSQIGFFKGWAYPPSNLDTLKLRIRCLGGSGDLYFGGFTVAPQIVSQYSSPNYSITTDESTTIGGNIKTVILKGATAITLTLEASVPIGHDIELQKVESNANQLTLTTSGGELIDGVASKSIAVDLYTTTIIRKISATEWRVSSGLQDSELITTATATALAGGRINFVQNGLTSNSLANWSRSSAGSITWNTSFPIAGGGALLATGLLSNQYVEGNLRNVDPSMGGRSWKVDISYRLDSNSYVDGELMVYLVDGATEIAGGVLPIVTGQVTSTSVFVFPTTTLTGLKVRVKGLGSGGTCDLRIGDITVAPQQIMSVPAVGGWIPYTPTISAGFTLGNGTMNFRWKQDGSDMLIRGAIVCGSTSSLASGGLNLSLPSPYTPVNDIHLYQRVGNWEMYDSSATAFSPSYVVNISNGLPVISLSNLTPTTPFVLAVNDEITVHDVRIPISQWSTNIQVSGESVEYASNSDVTATASITASGFLNGLGNAGNFGAGWTIGTNYTRRIKFKSPIRWGIDSFSLYVSSATGETFNISDNENITYICITKHDGIDFGCKFYPVAGDHTALDVMFPAGGRHPGSTYGVNGNPFSNIATLKWWVTKRSGGAMAEVPPVVRAEYRNQSTTGAVTALNYSTKIEDTHNAVTTGVGWKFTAPISGFYSLMAEVVSSTTTASRMVVYKNGTILFDIGTIPNISNVRGFGNTTIRLNQGDYIDVRSMDFGVAVSAEGRIIITRIGS